MNVAFPFQLSKSGGTATCTNPEHVSHLVYQLLFTAVGERVNRPTFGCGIRQLVFEPGGEVLAIATKQLIEASFQQWLGNVVEVSSLEVEAVDSALQVGITYRIRELNEQVSATYTLQT